MKNLETRKQGATADEYDEGTWDRVTEACNVEGGPAGKEVDYEVR